MAASQGHKPLVKELLRRGADLQVTNFSGKKCYDAAHDLNYWELGDYIREKAGLAKLGPTRKWQGEPGAPSLGLAVGEEITDGAISQLMRRREREKRLVESWGLLAQVDVDLVIAAITSAELKDSAASAPAKHAAGDAAAQEAQEREQQGTQAIQRLRAALGDARRAKVFLFSLFFLLFFPLARQDAGASARQQIWARDVC
jgi:ribosomal protein L12E/L44/L45/RPP1/RPP2